MKTINIFCFVTCELETLEPLMVKFKLETDDKTPLTRKEIEVLRDEIVEQFRKILP